MNSDYLSNPQMSMCKNLEAILLFADFSKVFDSIHRRNMEQILLAYGLPKETVTAMNTIMLYRNMKAKVCPLDGDTDFFDIVAEVLQGNTLAQYLFIICLDYVLTTLIAQIKKNGFMQKKKKARSRWYPAKTIIHADDIALLAHTPTQAESILLSLEHTAGGIGLHVNTNKTEYTYFKWEGAISTLSD